MIVFGEVRQEVTNWKDFIGPLIQIDAFPSSGFIAFFLLEGLVCLRGGGVTVAFTLLFDDSHTGFQNRFIIIFRTLFHPW